MEEFADKTDAELEAMREDAAPNAYVPTSIFHRLDRELTRRHLKRMEEAAARSTSIGILSNGANATITGNSFGVSEERSRPWWRKAEITVPAIVAIMLAIIGWVFFTPLGHTKDDSGVTNVYLSNGPSIPFSTTTTLTLWRKGSTAFPEIDVDGAGVLNADPVMASSSGIVLYADSVSHLGNNGMTNAAFLGKAYPFNDFDAPSQDVRLGNRRFLITLKNITPDGQNFTFLIREEK